LLTASHRHPGHHLAVVPGEAALDSALRSPKRWIATVRRELLDRILISNRRHLVNGSTGPVHGAFELVVYGGDLRF
jgi:hypothetical protein